MFCTVNQRTHCHAAAESMPYLHVPFTLLGNGTCFHTFLATHFTVPVVVDFGKQGNRKAGFFPVESGHRAMTRINENDCLYTIGMFQAGMLHTQFGVHINTIQALWRTFQQLVLSDTVDMQVIYA